LRLLTRSEDVVRRAEAEAQNAESRAAAARARADELRRQAGVELAPADEDTVAADDELPGSAPASRSRRWWPRPWTVVTAAAVALSISLGSASGYMVWCHEQAQRDQQRRAEFAAAAAQAVVTLMSIDSSKAEENVRQIVANSTGSFRDDFESAADDFIKVAHDSKAVTKANVGASAVESMTPNSAVVLVSANTTVSNSAGADQQPRNWRLATTMVDDGGQIKLSKVEFIP